ncbi:MAG: hypothetical protein E5V54_24020 [Mesorhizobium sp.]|nr:MAG: hypothetical protein E5V54_24020 [Mesorhizobium sp.]
MDEITKEVVRPREPASAITEIQPRVTRTVETEGLRLFHDDDSYTLALLVHPGNQWALVYDYSNHCQPDFIALAYPNSHIHLLAVRPVDFTPDLRARYNASIDELPWSRHDWFRDNVMRWIEHFPAPSETTAGLLAYFQTPEKRARDIRTPIKPGKYLKKFFADVLSDEEIHEAALEWSTHYAKREVKITQDADEIEKVYRGNYNGSCMHFGSGGWSGSCHPARAYAGPDLGIAYIGDIDKVDARCLVWPERKLYYAKWYGDGPRLEAALIDAGYHEGYATEFHSARIRRIEYGRGFVVPYVDVADEAEDDGTYLILSYSGDVNLRNTNGLSYDDEDTECDDCARDYDSSDEGYTTASGRNICDRCYDRRYFTCEGTNEVYDNDYRVTVGDEYYCSEYANEHFTYCEYEDEYVKNEDIVETVEDESVSIHYARREGFHCALSDRWDLDRSHRIRLSDGRYISTASLPELRDFLDAEGVEIATSINSSTDRLAA